MALCSQPLPPSPHPNPTPRAASPRGIPPRPRRRLRHTRRVQDTQAALSFAQRLYVRAPISLYLPACLTD